MAARLDRLPASEMANRAATAGAGLAAAAKAVGLVDHRRMLDDAARRVRDSHRAQMRLLGAEPDEPEGDDMPGDIIICGDITNTQPPPAPAIAAVAAAATKKIWPYVLAAALASGGLGAGAAALLPSILSRAAEPSVAPPAQSASIDTDTQYEVRISSGQPAPQSEQGPPP